MAEAAKVFPALTGILCTHLTRSARIVCTSGACCNRDVLFSQVPCLASHVHLLPAVLFCPGSVLRPGRATRVPEGAIPQVEHARAPDFGPGLFPLSMTTQHA